MYNRQHSSSSAALRLSRLASIERHLQITLDCYEHFFDPAAEQLADFVDALGREAADAVGASSVAAGDRRTVVPITKEGLTSGDAGIRTLDGAQHPVTA